MPCYYTGSAEGDAKLAHQQEAVELSREITNLTRLLCEACTELSMDNVSDELKKWWKQHQKIDKKNASLKKQRGLSKKQIEFINKNKELIKKHFGL